MTARTIAIALAILVAGCSKSPTDNSSPAVNAPADSSATSAGERIAAVSEPRFRVEPAELATCDDQVVRVI